VVRLFPALLLGARATGSRPARARGFLTAGTVALSLTLAVSAATADDLHDKHQQVQDHIDKVHDDLDESSGQVRKATTALLQARTDLANAQAYLAQTQGELAAAEALDRQMQAQLDAAVARLDDARTALAAGRDDVTRQEAQLRRLVVSSYEEGDPALLGLSMVFTTQDPAQLAGNMNATSSVVDTESKLLDRLRAAQVLLQVKEQDLQAAEKDVAERRQAAADNLVRKQGLEQQARTAAQTVSHLVTARQQAMDDAVQAKETDLAQLQRLQAERDKIEALIRSQTSQGQGYTGPSTGNGFLERPVDGPVTSPFGWRIHPIWGYRSLHDGVDFGAGCGTPIKAAADGTVLSEYFQSAWGNRIIVDHGVHFGVGVATISNHLSGYAVSVGDHVTKGQTIGYVGTTGWSTGCHLHFTVLQNGVAVDPMNWF
jgi:murein DD-endopeptidase MepM/ murein hydrolase activator NlpD